MIYVVEMDFRNPAREHDWHTWYLEHIMYLVRTIPGFHASQRFRSLTTSPSPWVALHEVAGPEVFETAEYKRGGGPASTGTWSSEHLNWQRNLFDGARHTPDVALDEHLVMTEGSAALPPLWSARTVRLSAVGLDRTSPERRIAVVPRGALTADLFGLTGVRILKPLTPKIGRPS